MKWIAQEAIHANSSVSQPPPVDSVDTLGLKKHWHTTLAHLLDCCICTAAYRANHGISAATLTDDSADNILCLTQFDNWLRRVLPFDIRPPDHGLSTLVLARLQAKRPVPNEAGTAAPVPKRRKTRLVVIDPTTPSNTSKKRQRQERSQQSKRQPR